MKILIHDLTGTTGRNGEETDGSGHDAVRIAGELFLTGVNVMLYHVKSRNVGTRKRPNFTPESIQILADDQRFQQR